MTWTLIGTMIELVPALEALAMILRAKAETSIGRRQRSSSPLKKRMCTKESKQCWDNHHRDRPETTGQQIPLHEATEKGFLPSGYGYECQQRELL